MGGIMPSVAVLCVRWNLVWLCHSLRSLTARGGQPAARLHNANSTLAACTKPNLVNFGERLCENDHSLATVAFLGQSIGDSRYVFDFFATATVAFLGQRIGDSRYGFAFFATGDVQ